MAASPNDLFMEVGEPGTATTLSAPGYTVGNTTINVASTSNYPTATGTVIAIDEAKMENGKEVRIDGTYNEYVCKVESATSFSGLSWKRGVGDRNYSAGSLTRVYIIISAERENRLVQGVRAQHNQDGTHGAVTATSVASSGLIASSGTVQGAVLKATSSLDIPDKSVTLAKLNGSSTAGILKNDVNGNVSPVAEQSWQTPTMTNSWVSFGGSFGPVAYMKDSMGFVHLRGLIKSGTMNAAAFMLPAGYRPVATCDFIVLSNSGIGAIEVNTPGDVVPVIGSNVYVSMDGITFRAEA